MKGLVGDGGEQQRERTRLYMQGQVTTSGVTKTCQRGVVPSRGVSNRTGWKLGDYR